MDTTDITRPKYPEGTPEYEAYREVLAIELAKFAAGEDPYPITRPGTPITLVEGRMYQVTTADGRSVRAFYKPIDGVRANHPWLAEDEARHRADSVTDIRALDVIEHRDPDALVIAVRNAVTGTGGTLDTIVYTTLRELGIEPKP